MSGALAQTNTDVLVIGAGVAGIKAAANLISAGITGITVVEARSRPLGRVDTRLDAAWPIPIELGAQWFHGGVSDNEVLAYAKSAAFSPVIPTVVTPDSEGVVFNNGTAVDDATDESWETLYAAFETFMRADRRAKGRTTALKTPLSDTVNAFIASRKLTGLTLQGFLTKIQTYIVQEYATNTDNLNLQLWDDDKEYVDDDSIPVAKTGYSAVFAKLLATIGPQRLLLNTEVTKVAFTSGAASPFTVETTKGTFNARYIICTLPLGVLQAKLTQLFPGRTAGSSWLTSAKVTAIRGLGMGTMNKVVLQFPSAFWVQKAYRQSWINRISSNPKQPMEFFSLFKATGQPILVAFYVGRAAVDAESMSDADTVSQVTAALQEMFGSSYQAPTNTLITRWASDPYSLGSYSFVKVGAGAKDARWQLWQAEAGSRFWLAGEAADETYPSTVQGAWRSGTKAASALVKVYMKAAAKAKAKAKAAAADDDDDD